jgi:flagellar M-ring protein FliF
MASFDSSRSQTSSGGAGGKVGATFMRLSQVQKIAVGAAIITLAAGVLMFSRAGSSQQMAPVYTDLEARDAASVTEGLASRGVAYELADGGRTVLVPRDQVYEMRVALSAEGLPRSNEGYALLDQQGITTSEFRQRIDYQRALEGELAMTLEAIDGIDSATVHLALPEESVFVDQPTNPTASVLVASAPSTPISNAQVTAMVHLVASSVKGMKPENVTIADATGNVLASGAGTAGGAGMGGADGRSDITAQMESDIANQLKAMIGRVTGMSNVAVSVRADLDLTEREAMSEIFDTSNEETGLVASERVASETYTGTQAGGETGVLGPDGAIVAPDVVAGGGESSYEKDDAERVFAINRTVESVRDAPGKLERLHVAVLVDEAVVTEEQVAAIEQLVSTASGIDPERGDQVVVTRLAFDTAAREAATEAEAAQAAALAAESRSSMIQTGVIALIALIAIVLAFLSTRKARREVVTPIDLEALKSAPVPGAASVLDDEPTIIDLPPTDPVHEASKHALEELSALADRKPEDIAQILHSWLADEVPT